MKNVKNKLKRPKNRSNKVNLVFDEAKRKDFLTGFHKRKVQRQKQAKENLERELKEERKRLKAEAKESYKKLVVSHRPIPELEHLLSEEYEDEDVTVKVTELSTDDIAKQNNWIGTNQPIYESDNEEGTEKTKEEELEEIPGMALKHKLISKSKTKVDKQKFESERQIKKTLKKQATKNVQKSKVFQKKNKVERQKQIKNSRKMKKQRIQIREKSMKRKKGSHVNSK